MTMQPDFLTPQEWLDEYVRIINAGDVEVPILESLADIAEEMVDKAASPDATAQDLYNESLMTEVVALALSTVWDEVCDITSDLIH